MTANRQRAERPPAPKAAKDEPVGPVAGDPSELNEVDAPATDSEFTRQQFWFLRQVAVNQPSALETAFVMADHANRKTGLMFVSQPSIRRILGRKDERSIRDQTKALERGGHIVFAGWVNLGAHANVKSYRWSLWDQRVERRLDQDLLGVRPSSDRNNSSGAETADRQKNSGAKSRRSGSITPLGPEDSRVLVRKKTSGKPSEEPSTRTDSSPADEWSFEIFEAEVRRFSNLTLSENFRRAWSKDVGRLRATGMGFAKQALPAVAFLSGEVGEHSFELIYPFNDLNAVVSSMQQSAGRQ